MTEPQTPATGQESPARPEVLSARNVGLIFSIQILVGAILLVNNIVMARLLGPSGKGMMALLVLVPTVLLVLVNCGFPLSASYFISRAEYTLSQVFGATCVLAAGSAVAILALSLSFWPFVQRSVFRGLETRAIVMSLASLPGLLLIYIFEPVWMAMGRTGWMLSVRLSQMSVYFLGSLLFVAVFGWGVFGTTLAFALGTSCGAATIAALVFRDGSGPPRALGSVLRRGLRFGLPPQAGKVADYALTRSDSILLGYLSDFQGFGYYSVAVPMAELVWYLSWTIGPVLFAHNVRRAKGEEWITPRILRSTLLLAAALAGAIFVAGYGIIVFVLPKFRPALLPLAILLAATVVSVIYQVVAAELTSRGQGGQTSRISLLALPIGILGYLLLIPRLGAVGAALGSLFAYFLQSALSLVALRRLESVSLPTLLLPRASDFSSFVGSLKRAQRPRPSSHV